MTQYPQTSPTATPEQLDGGPLGGTADPATLARIAAHFPALVLTGAGISAGAGIPTYRDKNGSWQRSDPIKHQEFIAEPRMRQRYWGRSILGWPGVRDARPASAHRSIAALESRGHLSGVVTQNVDRLHQRAGSQQVIDLHGRLDRVVCLQCGDESCRELLQQRLQRLNPQIHSAATAARPDGDADLEDTLIQTVRVPACELCGGVLMPDVVFFGGSIPGERVKHCRELLEGASSLLVIGSSLQVYSGYRFCRWARELQLPIFIINPGVTRADALADLKVEADADQTLESLLALRGNLPTGDRSAAPL